MVDFGNELTPTQVQHKPIVKWESDEESYYTLLMTDPDAPSRAEPTYGEVRHWLVGNIRGNAVEEGETFFDYLGCSPPKGSGLHRYIFFVFKQRGKLEFDEPKVDTTYEQFYNIFLNLIKHFDFFCSTRVPRYKTSTKKLIEKYGLEQPIAGNFFQAQWDEHVGVPQRTT